MCDRARDGMAGMSASPDVLDSRDLVAWPDA